MIYGRKGSVQLRIFRNKDNSNSSNEINGGLDKSAGKKLDILYSPILNSNDETNVKTDSREFSKSDRDAQNSQSKASNSFYESSTSNQYMSNKPLYLDSDDFLSETNGNNNVYNDESAIDEDELHKEYPHQFEQHSKSATSSPSRKRLNSFSGINVSLNKRRASSSSGYNKLIELEPFKNKVGGHTEIFKFSKRAICKTLVNKENEWYEHLEYQYTDLNNRYCGILLKFMPKYIGILNVRKHMMETEVTMNDNIHLFSQKMLEKYNISVDVDGIAEDCHHTSLNTKLKDQVLTEVFKCDDPDSFAEVAPTSRPDSPTQHYMQEEPDSEVRQYILLEDLTRKMKTPTVLDLKMGTRQYGVYANSKKKNSQTLKCKLTTSQKLGCRVCGMKIYRQSDDSFIKRDKYFGRRIHIGWQFARVLLLFLYDGISQASILQKIPKLIKDLSELISAAENLPGYRMYGASLLFMYDSEDSECNIYLIDFAQCITRENFLKNVSSFTCKPKGGLDQTDQGFIKGLKSLQFYLKESWNLMTDCKDLNDFLDSSKDSFKTELIMKFCSQEKFNHSFQWLDSFSQEDEGSFNDPESKAREHWQKFETHYNIIPEYSNLSHPFDESE